MSVALTASNSIIGFITVPYVTRVLSVEGYGNVSFAQSVAMWALSFCQLGVYNYGLRECAKVRDDHAALSKLVKELLVILAVTTAAVLAVFAAAIVTVPKLASISGIMWLFFVYTFLYALGVEWFFQAIEEYGYITKRSVLFKIISLVLIVLLVRDSGDELVYGAILALGMSANNVINLMRLTKIVDLRHSCKLDVRRHIRPLLSFSLYSLSNTAYNNADTVILGFVMATNYQVGLYQVGAKLKNLIFTVVNSILGVTVPRLSYILAQGDERSLQSLRQRVFYFAANAGVGLAAGLLVFAEPVVELLSGEAYLEAVPAVRALGLACLGLIFNLYVEQCVLMTSGREVDLARSNLLGAAVSVTLNFALDARLGALGAGLASLGAGSAILVCNSVAARDLFAGIVDKTDLLKIFASNSAASAASIAVLGLSGGAGCISQLLLGIPVYLLVWAAALLLSREQFALAVLRTFKRRLLS